MIVAATAILACTLTAVAATGVEPMIPTPAATSYHVRTTDSRVRGWLSIGASRSRTFQELLRRLERSDVIVYAQVVNRIVGGSAAQLLFVTSTATARYLRIEINGDGPPVQMVALLAHELQHAVEIADAPRAVDSRSMATLYMRPGENAVSYDSIAARVTGDRVRNEVANARDSKRVRSVPPDTAVADEPDHIGVKWDKESGSRRR
jgi:hypothetical protein